MTRITYPTIDESTTPLNSDTPGDDPRSIAANAEFNILFLF